MWPAHSWCFLEQSGRAFCKTRREKGEWEKGERGKGQRGRKKFLNVRAGRLEPHMVRICKEKSTAWSARMFSQGQCLPSQAQHGPSASPRSPAPVRPERVVPLRTLAHHVISCTSMPHGMPSTSRLLPKATARRTRLSSSRHCPAPNSPTAQGRPTKHQEISPRPGKKVFPGSTRPLTPRTPWNHATRS